MPRSWTKAIQYVGGTCGKITGTHLKFVYLVKILRNH